MSEINIQLVREFFELGQFSVLTHWRHGDERIRASEGSPLLFVEKSGGDEGPPPPLLPHIVALNDVQRAVVEVRAWHGDKFYPSVVESSPILSHVASSEVAGLAREIFGGAAFTTILVISELPASAIQRARSLQLFEDFGIGHVIEFGTLLHAIAAQLGSHGNYAPSQTLQTIRLLKRYGLLRRQQLEFEFPLDPIPHAVQPPVESDYAGPQDEEDLL